MCSGRRNRRTAQSARWPTNRERSQYTHDANGRQDTLTGSALLGVQSWSMIDASVVVVSYNVRDLLRRCLASIPGSAPNRTLEVLVVDNGSTDGSVETVRRDFPHVVLITNEANVGFTVANNQALAMSRGRA